MSAAHSMRGIMDLAENLGYSVEKTNGGHFRFTHPRASTPIFTSSTPSDRRAFMNMSKMLQRALRREK